MKYQIDLFPIVNQVVNAQVSPHASEGKEVDENGVDRKEAPDGFYATLKVWNGAGNICRQCEARPLCQANNDEWCLKNPCMSYGVIADKDGKIYRRNDGKSVVFKRIQAVI